MSSSDSLAFTPSGGRPAVPADDPTRAVGKPGSRLRMLDGWRAISILLVLSAHMLPLSPKGNDANGRAVGAMGMAIFFTLSGFLIVSILQRNPDVRSFLIRRLARIVPLAWTVLALSFTIGRTPFGYWLPNFLFYANLPPFWLDKWSSHFWSLGVEMQFYMAMALVVLLFGRRGLLLVPFAALAVTGIRVGTGTLTSVVTWLRVDEILSGGILALIIHGAPDGRAMRLLRTTPFWPALILFLLSTHDACGALNYLRPYLAATVVGITVVRPVRGMSPMLESAPMGYLARVSYAVYVIHHFTLWGWLGSGHGVAKYAKRPISLAITFGLAHLSTHYFEKRFIDWAHRITSGGQHKVVG